MTEYRLVTAFIRPPMRFNEMATAHHYTRAKHKKTVQTVVREMAQAQDIPHMDLATVKVIWYPPTARKADNDCLAPFLKATKDGLVEAGVWDDDNSSIVIEDRMAIGPKDADNPRIEIWITEVANVPVRGEPQLQA